MQIANDLLTFMSNAILNYSGKQLFGMRKPPKFNVPRWNERAKELNGTELCALVNKIRGASASASDLKY